MPSSYAQKQSIAQKKEYSSAASVFDSSSQCKSLQRKADKMNNAAQRAENLRPNNTGMPDNLKTGIESLSGFSMDDVRVHYNSSKPATVQALAYTQGTDIHVAPGQEKHLPHEAWHVAQQMAGRVSPTTNINGMPVNDNAALEYEADVMGEKAVQRTVSDVVKKQINLDGETVQRINVKYDYNYNTQLYQRFVQCATFGDLRRLFLLLGDDSDLRATSDEYDKFKLNLWSREWQIILKNRQAYNYTYDNVDISGCSSFAEVYNVLKNYQDQSVNTETENEETYYKVRISAGDRVIDRYRILGLFESVINEKALSREDIIYSKYTGFYDEIGGVKCQLICHFGKSGSIKVYADAERGLSSKMRAVYKVNPGGILDYTGVIIGHTG